MSTRETPESMPRVGWILYDGGCGFCYRWVHLWKKVVEKRGLALSDLQTALAEGLLEIPKEQLLDDIRVLTVSGESKIGADAYLFVAKRIWWAWPLYAIFRLPGFNRIFWSGYRWFNRNRYRVSKYCPMPQASESSKTQRPRR
jgi:predicted DCC family thiol-disulfide oxidoreductase YuxK